MSRTRPSWNRSRGLAGSIRQRLGADAQGEARVDEPGRHPLGHPAHVAGLAGRDIAWRHLGRAGLRHDAGEVRQRCRRRALRHQRLLARARLGGQRVLRVGGHEAAEVAGIDAALDAGPVHGRHADLAGRHRRDHARLAKDEIALDRARDPGDLLPLGRLAHEPAHHPEDVVDVEAGPLQGRDQGRRERAVAAEAVRGHGPGRGGIGDQGLAGRPLDRGQARPQRLLRSAERVVAACVEDDQRQLHASGVHRFQDVVDQRGLARKLVAAAELEVDREEVVQATVLERVAGIVEEAHRAAREGALDGVGHPLEVVAARILEQHGGETELAQAARDLPCIVARVQERAVVIGRVADHHRHPRLGGTGGRRGQSQHHHRQPTCQPGQHRPRPHDRCRASSAARLFYPLDGATARVRWPARLDPAEKL